MSEPTQSAKWTTKTILAQLRAQTGLGAKAKLHVFLDESVPPDMTASVAKSITEAAQAQSGERDATIGSVQRLARSFSITAHIKTLEAIAARNEVCAILPAEIDDAYPKPVRRGKPEE